LSASRAAAETREWACLAASPYVKAQQSRQAQRTWEQPGDAESNKDIAPARDEVAERIKSLNTNNGNTLGLLTGQHTWLASERQVVRITHI